MACFVLLSADHTTKVMDSRYLFFIDIHVDVIDTNGDPVKGRSQRRLTTRGSADHPQEDHFATHRCNAFRLIPMEIMITGQKFSLHRRVAKYLQPGYEPS